MNKSIEGQDFFVRNAEEVAEELLGKYICCKGQKEKYLIVATEAYYYEEDFCYGHGKTKNEAKRLVCAPLFERPGTWCIYGGQLLLSVTDDKFSDNVLIKKVKTKSGEILGPDLMARNLHLYKTKSEYCGCHGQYSLSEDSGLCLADGQEVSNIARSPRIGIADKKLLKFGIDGE